MSVVAPSAITEKNSSQALLRDLLVQDRHGILSPMNALIGFSDLLQSTPEMAFSRLDVADYARLMGQAAQDMHVHLRLLIFLADLNVTALEPLRREHLPFIISTAAREINPVMTARRIDFSFVAEQEETPVQPCEDQDIRIGAMYLFFALLSRVSRADQPLQIKISDGRRCLVRMDALAVKRLRKQLRDAGKMPVTLTRMLCWAASTCMPFSLSFPPIGDRIILRYRG